MEQGTIDLPQEMLDAITAAVLQGISDIIQSGNGSVTTQISADSLGAWSGRHVHGGSCLGSHSIPPQSPF